MIVKNWWTSKLPLFHISRDMWNADADADLDARCRCRRRCKYRKDINIYMNVYYRLIPQLIIFCRTVLDKWRWDGPSRISFSFLFSLYFSYFSQILVLSFLFSLLSYVLHWHSIYYTTSFSHSLSRSRASMQLTRRNIISKPIRSILQLLSLPFSVISCLLLPRAAVSWEVTCKPSCCTLLCITETKLPNSKQSSWGMICLELRERCHKS